MDAFVLSPPDVTIHVDLIPVLPEKVALVLQYAPFSQFMAVSLKYSYTRLRGTMRHYLRYGMTPKSHLSFYDNLK
jgi:hypothetical protein